MLFNNKVFGQSIKKEGDYFTYFFYGLFLGGGGMRDF